MNMIFRRCTVLLLLILMGMLAGCDFNSNNRDAPTLQPSQPVVFVNTPVPTLTPIPADTATPTDPPAVPASLTPIPAAPTQPAANTPPAAYTSTVPTSAGPTSVPVTSAPPQVAPTEVTTTYAPPTAASMVQVCETCGQLRLRQAPGSGGQVVTYLAANTSLNVIGRTADGAWLQVALSDGRNGWVDRQYLVVEIDLSAVSVTGVSEDSAAPPDAGSAYLSGISLHARAIYLDGQSKGNRAGAFAKVGDSITYSPAFLYPLVSGYNLGDYGYLASALSFFAGPNGRGENCFGASSIAAYPAWTTTDLLTPGAAKTGHCGAGETPIECEYRTGKPSVALIMLGTNDVAQGMSQETFRANLQRIVDISIGRGVIPVLSTIPPFPAVEGSARAFNDIIRDTARANDVPLWDFYRAINSLPNRGLSADAVHPSEAPDNRDAAFDEEHLQYGFTVRNLGALRVLDELWRQVLYDSGGAPPPASPPAPRATPTTVEAEPVDLATYTCPGASPLMLAVGGQGRVTPGVPNKVRHAPTLSGIQVGTIPAEGVFSVTGGPTCADGLSWWQIDYHGLTGWTAGGTADDAWVEPVPEGGD